MGGGVDSNHGRGVGRRSAKDEGKGREGKGRRAGRLRLFNGPECTSIASCSPTIGAYSVSEGSGRAKHASCVFHVGEE